MEVPRNDLKKIILVLKPMVLWIHLFVRNKNIIHKRCTYSFGPSWYWNMMEHWNGKSPGIGASSTAVLPLEDEIW